jgi:inner membrane protein involved in colicin E2 resistance
MQLVWKYEDAISAPGIGMEMPRELNAGPVAAQISFYAPLSLLLFFAVIIITALTRGVSLHPVNYVFLAAGFFAFPLLFSYMLDVVPVHLSFVIAALASLLLVCGYLRAAAGEFLFRVAVVAQTAYMVLFSYSFFFKGLTGLTLTLGGIVTLGVLMALTAKVDWSQKLGAVSPRLA